MKAEKVSVLIVDDERSNIIALSHILCPAYTIYAAKNGQDALEIVREFKPNIILLDILMPEMDGFEVLAILKSSDETRAIPVICITGLTEAEAEERGMALGASDYITKPFTSEIVKLRVRNQEKILAQINIINERLAQQTLMASISKSFLSNLDVNSLFDHTLYMVGEFMNIAQVLLFELNKDDFKLTCRNEWINPEFELPSRFGRQLILKEPMLSIVRGFNAFKTNMCLHSNDPAFKSAMRPYRENFVNYITTPIFMRGKLCAVLDFSREEDGQIWSESDIDLAIHVASILSGVYERSAMERQSSIVENSPQLIIYLSPDGEISYVNPAASDLTGYTKSEILSGGLSLVFDPETVKAIKETHIKEILQQDTGHFEINLKRKDGAARILSFTSFTAENGNIGAIAQDVTEIRALEAELITAKEQAEKSSRVKSEFLSRMSHEMLTPMNAIMGMTKVAELSDTLEKKTFCLDEISHASRHLFRLINNALDASVLEKEIITLESAEFSFSKMLQTALEPIRARASEKNQDFSFAADPSIPDALIGDEKRLVQVIRNLLMNANKFTPEGGEIRLHAALFGEEDCEAIIKIIISDTGIGIPENKQAVIFEPFEQADVSFSREFSGLGLGLPIAKQIIELMGGKIWVESEPGQGAVFSFIVRILCSQCTINPASEIIRFDNKTALLVEDVEINREILMAMLEDTKIKIDCAENGLQAIEIFKANPGKYDIILMDISMPLMDGWETARHIRQMEGQGPHTKIVALTANTLQEDVQRSFDAGMNDHIGKPIDFSQLVKKLSQYLN